MSKSYADWNYERSCQRKIDYETMHAASSKVIDRNIRDREKGWRWSWYECRFCGKYHLTCEKPRRR